MNFWPKILAYRDFLKFIEIKEAIANLQHNAENVDYAQPLIFFKTPTKQTWLISTNCFLYCVWDDTSVQSFDIRWKIPKEEIFSNGNFNLQLMIDPHYKKKYGRIDFGEKHRNWLYSKDLFESEEKLKKDIIRLSSCQMK